MTQDPVRSITSKKGESEASFYSLYDAGSSLSIDLDIWENEVVVEQTKKDSDENIHKKSKKNSKSSNGSFHDFCKETLSWLEEDVFRAPKATIDHFEDDEIVSSFSNFNRLMENLSKENKMSDLSDFDERQEDSNEEVAVEATDESSSKSSSEEQVGSERKEQ